MVTNKRGWIKIVEAFVAILLIIGVLLILINKGYIGEDISLKIYEAQISILRGIQVDSNLRMNILNTDENNLAIEWEDFEFQGLENVKNKIIEQTPDYLNCMAKICKLNDSCLLNDIDKPDNKEIYAQPTTISANYLTFSPRQLKLFCWVR